MKISDYRNYIYNDPFLDYINKNNHGYKMDTQFRNFDPELQLGHFTKEMKKQFIEKIRYHIGSDFQEYELGIGKIDLLMKTAILRQYFRNGSEYSGNGYSMITIEYAKIKVNGKELMNSGTPSMKYYLFKNWMLKKNCPLDIDYSFVVGRCSTSYPAFDMLYENTCDFTELLVEMDAHLKNIEDNKYILGKNIFPNMKNKQDFPWHNAKKKVAEKIQELTNVRGISVKKRNDMISKGIKLDKSKLTNLDCVEQSPRDGDLLYIDFETVGNTYDDFSEFPKSNTKCYLFNIGCGYTRRGNFHFNSYVAHDLDEECSVVTQFVEFVNSFDKPILVHWTNIENRVLLKKLEQFGLNLRPNTGWFDMHNYFLKNKLQITNCYTYKLKHVARALRQQGLIVSKWDNTFSDGLGAMTGYIKYLRCKDKKIINNIAHYNMIDCKVLWEINMLL